MANPSVALGNRKERNMQPYLLALDLDGTACDDHGHLGQKSKQALLRARSLGHIICFASGRRDVDMYSMGEDANCADYLLLNNGGKLIRTADGKVLRNQIIETSVAKTLIEHCLAHNLQLHIVSGMYWGINRWNESLQAYVDELGLAPVLYDALEQTPYDRVEGFMATVDCQPVCRFIDDAQLPLSHVHAEPTCTDIMALGINKWQGLKHLAAMLGVDRQRIIAAGNFTNDIEMIEQAGIGVAVSNALEQVKAAADYVTKNDNNHDAVADIVEQFLLQ